MTPDATTEDDLRQLRDALRGALGTAGDDVLPVVDEGWRGSWPALAELGLTTFCVPEDRGGFGLQVEAAVVTAEELGVALHGSPFAALTAAGHALGQTDDPAAHELLDGVISGERICTFGVLDEGSGAAWVVDGAPEADALVLAEPSTGGLLLFAEPGRWSVEVPAEPFDVSRTSGTVEVDVAGARRLGPAPAAHDLQRLLLAADAVGCVRRMHERTVAYAAERVAFGKPIGAFQAVQHRLADHAVRTRGMALLVAEAARLLGSGDDAAGRYVALAGVSVTSNATHVLHDLLQLTGGIGFTWEYGLHFYERRTHQDARLAAGSRAAVRSLVEIEGWSR